MTEEFHLIIETPPPSINGCHRHSGNWTYKTPKYKNWQSYVHKHLEEEYKITDKKTLIGEKPFKLRLRQRFKSKRKRDLDNYIKPLLDTLEGYIFDDDCQLEKLTVTKEINYEYDEFELVFYY